jgi:hypothetical protein
MSVNHSFAHHKDPLNGDIYVKLDDIVFAFLKEASSIPDEATRNFMVGSAMFFNGLKESIVKEDKEIRQVESRKTQESKTWWGKIIWESKKS